MAKRKTTNKRNSVQTIFSRFMLIVAFFVIWIGIIGVRLVHLQVNQAENFRGKAQNQRRSEHRTKTLRGSIFDRANRALALSVKVKSLYADPKKIDDVQAAAQTVASFFKLKTNEVAKNLLEAKSKEKRFVWLIRKIDEETAQKFNEHLKSIELKSGGDTKFAGLHWKEEQKRTYPYSSVASHVIGFSDLDDNGKAGIELSQEKVLRGAILQNWKDRDRLGRVYDESEDIEEREPPKDLVLTISSSIQYKVEEALRQGVEAANAKSGMAVVLDPKTGEILAMANYPTFDLNKFNETAPELYTNKAIQNFYTPGSVFKLVTYSGALEEKMITPHETVDVSKGSIDVAGHVFTDSHRIAEATYTDAFAASSNVGAIKTGLRLGKENFYSYARHFGFGQATGIELPAEAGGIIRSPEKWNGDSLASMSIGYEIGVTALQSASAFAIIANDGVRVKPHIIKEIRQADGKVFSTTEAEKVQIVSPDTARGMRQMMQKVVLSGTGKRAQLNGYTSAGKTGTAWKYDDKLKKINDKKFVSSFIGFAPFDNPAVVIAIILDEPQGAVRDGGHVSAPIFRSIAEQILPELNVAPDGFVRQDTTEVISETEETEKTEKEAESKAAVTKPLDSETPNDKKRIKGNEKTSDTLKKGKDGKLENEPGIVKPKTASIEKISKNETKNKSPGKAKT